LIYSICSMMDSYTSFYLNSVYGLQSIFTSSSIYMNNDQNVKYYTDNGNQDKFRHNRIYIIEDIDTLLGKKRQDEKKDNVPMSQTSSMHESSILNEISNMTLHSVLNSFDGFTSGHGMIIFITTNKIDKLDSALLRKGRIDLCVNIGKMESDTFKN